MRDINIDLKYGKKSEKQVKPILDKVFGELTQDKDKFANFDFFNDKYHVEHKQRSIKGKYVDLFFDKVKYDKYIELKKKGKRCFIVWSCKDDRYVWEFCDQFDDNDEAQFYFKTQKNFDRGKGYLQDTEMVNVFSENISTVSEFKI